jgi:hypothetical protein
MPVWPVSAIITTTSLTRSRNVGGGHLLLSSRIGVLREVVAHEVATLAVAAVEQGAHRVDVDLRLR